MRRGKLTNSLTHTHPHAAADAVFLPTKAYFFALYRVPETAGLSLEETRLLFVGKRALDGSSTQVDGDGTGAGAGAGYGYQALRDEEPEPEPEPDTETDPPRVDR